MASIVANFPPRLMVPARETHFSPFQKIPGFATKVQFVTNAVKQDRLSLVAKAMGESSESSNSLSIVKSVKNVWENSEDRIALIGLGFAAVVALWASTNLITAIDTLPLVPNVLELVGLLFSSWFVYRYLLLKPDREELFQILNKYISDILGQ